MNKASHTQTNFPASNALRILGRLLEYPGAEFVSRLETAATLFQGWPTSHQTRLSAWLSQFSERMRPLAPEEREELYTATFDVTPSCVAYVSIHLFGEENFKRGEFMAALNARYAQAGFDAQAELPDHLSNLLRFAAELGISEWGESGPLERGTLTLPTGQPAHETGSVVRVPPLGGPGTEGWETEPRERRTLALPTGQETNEQSSAVRYSQTNPELRELVEYCLLGPLDKMRGALDESHPYRALLELVRETLLTAVPGAQAALSPVEQMRRQGAACVAIAPGCGCGSVAAPAAENLEPTIPVPQYG